MNTASQRAANLDRFASILRITMAEEGRARQIGADHNNNLTIAALDIADLARKLMRVRELRAHAFIGELDARASDVTAALWALAQELAPGIDVEAVLEQVRAHGPDLEAALEHIQKEPS